MSWTEELKAAALQELGFDNWSTHQFSFKKSTFRKDLEVDALVDDRTGYFFAVHAHDEGWKLERYPGTVSFRQTKVVSRKRALLKSLTNWVRLVSEQRECLFEWPEECGAREARRHLLLTELELIGQTLNAADIPLTRFRWERARKHWALRDVAGGKSSLRLEVVGDNAEEETILLRLDPVLGGADGEVDVDRALRPRNYEEWRHEIHGWVAGINEQERPEFEAPRQGWLTKVVLAEVRLTNIRRFEDFFWKSTSKESTLLLIGANGTGKSTFLRCLAIALMPRAAAQLLLNSPLSRLLGDPAKEGKIELTLNSPDGSYRVMSVIEGRDSGSERIVSQTVDEQTLRCQVFGYGAGRAVGGQLNLPGVNPIRDVGSLFHYRSALMDPGTFFRRLERFPEAVQAACLKSIRSLLDMDSRFGIEPTPGGVEVHYQGERYSLSSWADGYRLTLQWLIDLWNAALNDLTEDSPWPSGILLVDEVELHMHPKLQARLVQRIRQALPNVLCIFTTHSPILALSVESGQILHLKRADKKIRAAAVPDTTGFTIEDIFTDSELFDASPYGPDTEALLDRWRKLSLKPVADRTEDEQNYFINLTRWMATT